MADGAGQTDMQSLRNAVMALTGEVREMRGELKSYVNNDAHARQRVEIRAETESMIGKEVAAHRREQASERKADIEAAEARGRAYADAKIEKLELRLAAQEERDSKREGDMQRQQIALAGMAIIVVGYTLIQSFGGS